MIGAPNRSVWALGDCAVSGCAPTAQSASQQGKYLGALFRDTNMDKAAMAAHPDFKFIDKGSLAYLGDGKGKFDYSYTYYQSRKTCSWKLESISTNEIYICYWDKEFKYWIICLN